MQGGEGGGSCCRLGLLGALVFDTFVIIMLNLIFL